MTPPSTILLALLLAACVPKGLSQFYCDDHPEDKARCDMDSEEANR